MEHSRGSDDHRLDVRSRQECLDALHQLGGRIPRLEQTASILRSDRGGNEMGAAYGAVERFGMEGADPPQSNHAKPDAAHAFTHPVDSIANRHRSKMKRTSDRPIFTRSVPGAARL